MATADPTTAESSVMPGDGDSSKEIVRRTRGEQYAVEVMPLMTDGEIRRYWRVAQALAASRMFKDSVQAEQAFAKILLGRDLGLSPTQAMNAIHIIEGKPEIAAVTLASFVRRRSDTRYQIVEQTNDACEIHFYAGERTSDTVVAEHHAESCPRHVDPEVGRCSCRPSREYEGEEYRGPSRFDNADMELAELNKPTRSGAKSNHTKFPRNMKFARAMSNGVKWLVPETVGGVPIYAEGELYEAAVEAPARAAEELRALPPVLAELLERAQAVDSRRWRRNEILARLPHPDADEFVPAVDGLAAEIQVWLAENEPSDAEVVGESEQSVEDAEEADDPRLALQRRYETDAEWREQIDPVLARYADLETALDDALTENNNATVGELTDELDVVKDQLDALGVPAGWYPGI